MRVPALLCMGLYYCGILCAVLCAMSLLLEYPNLHCSLLLSIYYFL